MRYDYTFNYVKWWELIKNVIGNLLDTGLTYHIQKSFNKLFILYITFFHFINLRHFQ